MGGLGKAAAMIGKEAVLKTAREGLQVKVRILDVRQVYGRTELLVEPVSGTGKAWVEAKRVAT